MRHSLHLPGALALILALGGCPSSTSPTTAGSTRATDMTSAGTMGAVVETQRYFPLQRTYSWTYAVTITAPSTTSTAVDTTSITSLNDSGGTKTAGYLSSRTVAGTVVSQDTGTITQTGSQLTLSSNGGSEVINLPFRSGNEWTSGTFAARAFAIPSMRIGGKDYKDLFAINYVKDGDTRAVRYLAAGYGIVKQITKNTINGETVTTVAELTSSRLSAVTAVTALPATLTLSVGGTASLNVQVAYDDGSVDKDLLLSAASQAVATVNTAGLVTAVGTGSTTVTARSNQDATKTAVVTVTVN